MRSLSLSCARDGTEFNIATYSDALGATPRGLPATQSQANRYSKFELHELFPRSGGEVGRGVGEFCCISLFSGASNAIISPVWHG